MIVALAGGVGGAKLADGLAQLLPPGELVIAVNTGDDFVHLGLQICPDLDTVMYTLGGVANAETGWGLAGETWHFMEALAHLHGETWFRLGDRDLATHIQRTLRLSAGEPLSGVTAALCRSLGVAHHVVPMSDEPVRTTLETDAGTLAFQDYFVRRGCAPKVRSIEFAGAATAHASPPLMAALGNPRLRAVIVCPSNPYLSVAPMIAIPELARALARCECPIVAVSPIIGDAAVKGPAAKIMVEFGHAVSCVTVAREYSGWVDGLVIDESDRGLAGDVQATGMHVHVAPTLMTTSEDRATLAAGVLAFAGSIGPRRRQASNR